MFGFQVARSHFSAYDDDKAAMSETTSFDVRHVGPKDAGYREALRLAIGAGTADTRNAVDATVDGLILDAKHRGLSLDLLFGAFQGSRCVSAVLAVESPGHTALVFAPAIGFAPGFWDATKAALEAVKRASWERSILLLEMLLQQEQTDLSQAVRASGFRCLTRLMYMVRPTATQIPPAVARQRSLEWTTYADERVALYVEAIERSYAQSLDCPELTGRRSVPDVLSGHRAAGPFDPTLWSVAAENGEPVAVLLQSLHQRGDTVEIVYMGVAQTVRGTGVADAVMIRALEAARRVCATSLALAVDHRNTPARRLYQRWGFTCFSSRDAWIVTPPVTEG